jgi:hypothetical protein
MAWLKDGLTLTKIHTLLGRRGVVVSYRTLNRYATAELDFGRRQATVPVVDCEPGAEVQVDFGRLGLLTDAADGRRRVVHGLIFTAVYSAHVRLAYLLPDPQRGEVSPTDSSMPSNSANPSASSAMRRFITNCPSASITAKSWWSSAQSIPQNLFKSASFLPSFLPSFLAVSVGPALDENARRS